MESKPERVYHGPEVSKAGAAQFLGGSDAGIITSADEAPVMRRPRHEQNIQCLDIITGNPVRTCALVAKSSTAQTPRLRLIGVQTREAATGDSRLPKILQPSSRLSEGSGEFTPFYGVNSTPAFRNTLSIKAIESWFPA